MRSIGLYLAIFSAFCFVGIRTNECENKPGYFLPCGPSSGDSTLLTTETARLHPIFEMFVNHHDYWAAYRVLRLGALQLHYGDPQKYLFGFHPGSKGRIPTGGTVYYRMIEGGDDDVTCLAGIIGYLDSGFSGDINVIIVTWLDLVFDDASLTSSYQLSLVSNGDETYILVAYGEMNDPPYTVKFIDLWPKVDLEDEMPSPTSSNFGLPGLYIYRIDGFSLLQNLRHVYQITGVALNITTRTDAITNVGQPTHLCIDSCPGQLAKCWIRDIKCVTPSLTSGTVAVGTEYRYGNTLRFQCMDGYEYTTGTLPVLTCEISGEWSEQFPECTRIDCPEPTNPDPGVTMLTGEDWSLGDIVIIWCIPGYHNPGAATATCQADKTWTEISACVDINECLVDPHHCQGICTNTPGSFVCSCTLPKVLADDGVSCIDQMCGENNHGCEELCMRTGDFYACACNPGMALTADAHTCEDVDECATNEDECDEICHNTYGSYVCSCGLISTLSADKRTCIDRNECDLGLDNCQDICINTVGSYECACKPGFRLGENGFACLDIDECANNMHACEALCQNTYGSFKCACETGFRIADDGVSCEDIDECAVPENTCEGPCTNTFGSYMCTCPAGYTIATDGLSCIDVDECSGDDNVCSDVCINTFGAYKCACNAGFIYNEAENNCVVDPNGQGICSTAQNNCEEICINTLTSFSCACNPGKSLAPDGRTCLDVNECANGNYDCAERCINTNGSYMCACESSKTLADDGRTCKDRNECQDGSSTCDGICINTVGSYVCTCAAANILASDGSTCGERSSVRLMAGLDAAFNQEMLSDPSSPSAVKYCGLFNDIIRDRTAQYGNLLPAMTSFNCSFRARYNGMAQIIATMNFGRALSPLELSVVSSPRTREDVPGLVITGKPEYLIKTSAGTYQDLEVKDECFLYNHDGLCGELDGCVVRSGKPYCRCSGGVTNPLCYQRSRLSNTVIVILGIGAVIVLVLICAWFTYKCSPNRHLSAVQMQHRVRRSGHNLPLVY